MNGHVIVEGLNSESTDILNNAFRISLQDNCAEATTLHLMVAALENMRIANQFTETTGVNTDAIFDEYCVRIEEETDVLPEKDRIYIANVVISRDLDEILTKSSYIYRVTGQLITPEMLIYLMMRQTNTPATRLLKGVDAGVEESVGKFRLLADLSADSEEFDIEEVEEFDISKKPVASTQDYFEAIHGELIKSIFGNMSTYDKNDDTKDKIPYGLTNLTEKVYSGEIEPSINRDYEILDIIETLSKKKNANALLIGEPGVGKTSIVHGFVHKLSTDNTYEEFIDKEVYELKVDRLVQGSGMRGELESRLNGIIDFIKSTGSILVIDEFQSLMKLGDVGGSVSPINILKPYLESGEINVIGMTTLSEYKNM
ncbi:MAG: ATP-dependent Clp protease ATP-binding subunit [Lachnospiraceae bacterium]|nr:ATP-dependent Clp protease ATP-binding subunit [Lachnospiraceae bacterium]